MSRIGSHCAFRRRKQWRSMRNFRRDCDHRCHAEEAVARLRGEVQQLGAAHRSTEGHVQIAEESLHRERDQAIQRQIQNHELQSEASELRQVLEATPDSPMSLAEDSLDSVSQMDFSSLCLLLKMKLGLALAHCRDVDAKNSALRGDTQNGSFSLPSSSLNLKSSIDELQSLTARLDEFGSQFSTTSTDANPEHHDWSEGHEELMVQLRAEYRRAVARTAEQQRRNSYRSRELAALREAWDESVKQGDEQTQILADVRSENSRVSSILELVLKDLHRLQQLSTGSIRGGVASETHSKDSQDISVLEDELRELRRESEAAVVDATEAEECVAQCRLRHALHHVEGTTSTHVLEKAFVSCLPPLPEQIGSGELKQPGVVRESVSHAVEFDGVRDRGETDCRPLAPSILPSMPFALNLPSSHQQEHNGDLEESYEESNEADQLAEVQSRNDELKEEILEVREHIEQRARQHEEQAAAAREQIEQQALQRTIVALKSRLTAMGSPLPSSSSPGDGSGTSMTSIVHIDDCRSVRLETPSDHTDSFSSDATLLDMGSRLATSASNAETVVPGGSFDENSSIAARCDSRFATAPMLRRHLPSVPCLPKTQAVPRQQVPDFVPPICRVAEIKPHQRNRRVV